MRAVWLTGLAALALFAGLAWYLAPLQPNIVTLQFAFTPAAFGAVIHSWPAEHLARYRAHFGADFVLLACYGAFGYLCAARTRLFAALAAGLQRAAKLALPLAAVFDAAENLLHLWLTAVPRFGTDAVYASAALAAGAKWALLLAFAALAVLALRRARD